MMKTIRSLQFRVLVKVIKCALRLSHGNSNNERKSYENKMTLTKGKQFVMSLNGL